MITLIAQSIYEPQHSDFICLFEVMPFLCFNLGLLVLISQDILSLFQEQFILSFHCGFHIAVQSSFNLLSRTAHYLFQLSPLLSFHPRSPISNFQ